MLKRLFDIIFSFLAIIILLPLLLLIMVWIIIDSGWPPFYKQIRVGKNEKSFTLLKFRTMHKNAEKRGMLTIGMKDTRITPAGYFLRKYKLDELPQLFNIFMGTMSFVGPRPEVKKYVDLYNNEQKEILQVRPGLTDFASIEYFEENAILASSETPEKEYIEKIMPKKILLNKKYIQQKSLATDMKIIYKTLLRIMKGHLH
ncbi:MAG: sugar transferase [Bacteroidales bacterium]|nr:sugar transferase [Bacteroidales bacterium]